MFACLDLYQRMPQSAQFMPVVKLLFGQVCVCCDDCHVTAVMTVMSLL